MQEQNCRVPNYVRRIAERLTGNADCSVCSGISQYSACIGVHKVHLSPRCVPGHAIGQAHVIGSQQFLQLPSLHIRPVTQSCMCQAQSAPRFFRCLRVMPAEATPQNVCRGVRCENVKRSLVRLQHMVSKDAQVANVSVAALTSNKQ